MTDENPGWSRAEKAGAVLLLLMALGLGFVAGDILLGGRLLRRGCCQDQDPSEANVVDQ
jgi:hypothetical protein